MLGIDILNEAVAYYWAVKYRNTQPVYNIYGFIEFFMVCWYFNNTIDVFFKKNIGIYIGIAGVCLGILNMIFLQPIVILNSYYLFLEGTCIIGMALFSFFRLLLQHEQLRLYRYPHFWFTSVLLFYWSLTYLTWGLFNLLIMKLHYDWVDIFIACVSIITYIALALIFLFYKKMQSADE